MSYDSTIELLAPENIESDFDSATAGVGNWITKGVPLALASAGVSFANLPKWAWNKIVPVANEVEYTNTYDVVRKVETLLGDTDAFSRYYAANDKGVELGGAILGGIATFPVGGGLVSGASKALQFTGKAIDAAMVGKNSSFVTKTAELYTGLNSTFDKARYVNAGYKSILTGDAASVGRVFTNPNRYKYAGVEAANWGAQGLAYEAVAVGAMIANPTYERIDSISEFAKEVASGALFGAGLGFAFGAVGYGSAKIANAELPKLLQGKDITLRKFAEFSTDYNSLRANAIAGEKRYTYSAPGDAVAELMERAVDANGARKFTATPAELEILNGLTGDAQQAFARTIQVRNESYERAFNSRVDARFTELSASRGVADELASLVKDNKLTVAQGKLAFANAKSIDAISIAGGEKAKKSLYVSVKNGEVFEQVSPRLGDFVNRTTGAEGNLAYKLGTKAEDATFTFLEGPNKGVSVNVNDIVAGNGKTASLLDSQVAWQFANDAVKAMKLQPAAIYDSPYALANFLERTKNTRESVKYVTATGTPAVATWDAAYSRLQEMKKAIYIDARKAGSDPEVAALMADLPVNFNPSAFSKLPVQPRVNNFLDKKFVEVTYETPVRVNEQYVRGAQTFKSLLAEKLLAANNSANLAASFLNLDLKVISAISKEMENVSRKRITVEKSVEAGALTRGESKFDTMSAYAQAMGSQVATAVRKLNDDVSKVFAPEIKTWKEILNSKALDDISVAAELEVLHQRVQASKERVHYAAEIDDDVKNLFASFNFNDGNLNGLVQADDELVKLARKFAKSNGAVKSQLLQDITSALGEVRKTFIPIQSDAVNSILQSYVKLENQRRVAQITMDVGMGAREGAHIKGEIYFKQPDSNTHPFWVLVEDKGASAIAGIAEKASLHARTAEELTAKIERLETLATQRGYTMHAVNASPNALGIVQKSNLEFSTVQELAAAKRLDGTFRHEEKFSSYSLDNTLKREGVYGEFEVQPAAEIISDMVRHLMRENRAVVTRIVRNYNPELISQMETASLALSRTTSSAKGNISTKYDINEANDIYAQHLRVMFDIAPEAKYNVLVRSQAYVADKVNALMQRVKDATGNKRYDQIDDKMLDDIHATYKQVGAEYGIDTSRFTKELIATLPQNTRDARTLERVGNAMNTAVTALLLVRDSFNGIVQALSIPFANSAALRQVVSELPESARAAITADGITHSASVLAAKEMANFASDVLRIRDLEKRLAGETLNKENTIKLDAWLAQPAGQRYMAELNAGHLLTSERSLFLDIATALDGPSVLMSKLETAGKSIDRFAEQTELRKKTRDISMSSLRMLDSVLTASTKYSELMQRYVANGVANKIADELKMSAGKRAAFVNQYSVLANGAFVQSQRPQIFQGVVGQMYGLYKSYSFNVMQNILRNVSEGRARDSLLLLGMQASMFGIKSVPGWEAFNQYYATNIETGDDAKSRLYQLIGKTAADTALYGPASQLTISNIYTRANLNPRDGITGIIPDPTNLSSYAAASIVANSTANAINAIYTGMNGELDVGRIIPEIATRQQFNRPLARFTEYLQGYKTDATGKLKYEIDRSNWNYASALVRIAGATPIDEALAIEDVYRTKAIKKASTDKINAIAADVRKSVANDEDVDVGAVYERYVRSGGSAHTFNRWYKRKFLDATTPEQERFSNSIRNSEFYQEHQRISE